MTKHCSWNEDLKRQRDQREWERALAKIEEGHEYFKERKYDQAIDCYEEAKIMCPAENKKELSTFFLDGAEAIIDENLKTGEMIIEECNPALEQNELLKVLERLSTTREHNCEMRNALESVTWMCLLEGFSNDQPTANAERITKKINKSMTTLDIAVRFVTESIQSNAEDSNKRQTLDISISTLLASRVPDILQDRRTSLQDLFDKSVMIEVMDFQKAEKDQDQVYNYETEEALVDKGNRKTNEDQEIKAEIDKLIEQMKDTLKRMIEETSQLIQELSLSGIHLPVSSRYTRSNKPKRTSSQGSVNDPVMNEVDDLQNTDEDQCQVQDYETEEECVDKVDRKKKEQKNEAETDQSQEVHHLCTDEHFGICYICILKQLEEFFERLSTDIDGNFKDFQNEGEEEIVREIAASIDSLVKYLQNRKERVERMDHRQLQEDILSILKQIRSKLDQITGECDQRGEHSVIHSPLVTSSRYSSRSNTPERISLKVSNYDPVMNEAMDPQKAEENGAQVHNCETEEAWVHKKDRKKKEEKDNESETDKWEKQMERNAAEIERIFKHFKNGSMGHRQQQEAEENIKATRKPEEDTTQQLKKIKDQRAEECDQIEKGMDLICHRQQEEAKEDIKATRKQEEDTTQQLKEIKDQQAEECDQPIASHGKPHQNDHFQTQGLTEKREKYIAKEPRRILKQVAKVVLQKDEILDFQRLPSETQVSISFAIIKCLGSATYDKPDQDENDQIQHIKEKSVKNIAKRPRNILKQVAKVVLQKDEILVVHRLPNKTQDSITLAIIKITNSEISLRKGRHIYTFKNTDEGSKPEVDITWLYGHDLVESAWCFDGSFYGLRTINIVRKFKHELDDHTRKNHKTQKPRSEEFVGTKKDASSVVLKRFVHIIRLLIR